MKQCIPLLSSLSLCSLLFCLCLLLLPAKSQRASLQSSDYLLLSYPMEQLDKLSFEEFSLLNIGSELVLEDMESLPLQESRSEALLALLADCSGAAASLPQGEPLRQLRLFLVDGATRTLSLYNVEKSFVLSDGQAAITLPPQQAELLLWQMEDYAQRQILAMDLPEDGNFLLSGALHEQALQFSYYIEDSQLSAFLTAPRQAELPEDTAEKFLSSLKNLQAEQVCVIAPDQAELHQYGLSAPFCVLQGDLYEESFTLSVSQPREDGCVYLMKEGLPLIYEVKISALPWLSFCKESLTEENLFSADYEDSTAFTLSTENVQYHFTKWAGQVLCKGRSIDEKNFHELYRLATTLIPTEAALHAPRTEPLLQLSIAYTNPAKAKDFIIFYPYDEDSLLLSLNGDCRFLIEQEQAEEILSLCADFFA